jgi:hypothetical protein
MLNITRSILTPTTTRVLPTSINPLLSPRPTVAVLEDDMRRLPHLREDRRLIVKEQRRRVEDARRTKTASEAIGRLPTPDEAVHLAISGRFALWNVVPAVLELAECRIETLTIATLGFSRGNVDDLCSLIDAGQIANVSLLCSHYFKGTSNGIYEHAEAELAKRPVARFLSCRQHAKLLLLRLEDGQTITVESSANLRSCKNIETMTLIGSPEVYHFHKQWIDELFAEARNHPTPKARSATPRIGYSQRRAGMGVWAATTDEADRAAAIRWKSSPPDEVITRRYAEAIVR